MAKESLQCGWDSFWVLGESFLATVLGLDPPNRSSSVCHIYGSNSTEFFLDPFFDVFYSDQYEYDVCEGSDWIVMLIQFLFCLSLSWASRWLLWEPFARWHMGKRATVRRVNKFSSIFLQFCSHNIGSLVAYRVLKDKEWLWEREQWSQGRDSTVESDVKFLYLWYVARYAEDIVSIVADSHIARSDTWAFVVHHLVTIALVLGSAQGNYLRIGCVIMYCMDWADVFLTSAKLFKYLSRDRKDVYQLVADFLFGSFAVCFILTRNIMFSYVAYVCYVDFPPESNRLKFFVFILVCLMFFWLALIVRTAVKQFLGDRSADDIRSDDEQEDESPGRQRMATRKKGEKEQ